MPSTTPANIANPWIWCEHLHPKERSYWNKTRSKHRSPTPAQAGTTLLLFHQKQTSGPSPKEPTSKPRSNETAPSCNPSRFYDFRVRQVDFPPPATEYNLSIDEPAETELMAMTITSPLQTRNPQSGPFGTVFFVNLNQQQNFTMKEHWGFFLSVALVILVP